MAETGPFAERPFFARRCPKPTWRRQPVSYSLKVSTLNPNGAMGTSNVTPLPEVGRPRPLAGKSEQRARHHRLSHFGGFLQAVEPNGLRCLVS